MRKLAAILCILCATFTAKADIYTDYALGVKVARECHKPILLEFYTDNCPWCQKLDVTFGDPVVARTLRERYVVIRLNGAAYPWLVAQLGVRSYPTVVFVSPDLVILERHVGYIDVAPFVVKINTHSHHR